MPCRLLPIAKFPTVCPDWDALNDANYRHPLLESRFLATALEYMGDGNEQVAICESNGSVEAVIVLAKDKLATWGTFQASQSPLGALIVKPGVPLEPLVADLLGELPKVSQLISLTQQDPEIVPRPPDSATLRTLDYIDTARITVDGDFDDYWAGRGKNLRHNMKRQRNRLGREDTELRVDMLTEVDQMREGVRSYGDLESLGWKTEKGTAVHSDNAQGRFYTALLETYAATGNARIYRCYYNDQLSAVDLCITNATTFVILKTTYDETIKTSSPALLMRREYFPSIFDNREVERIEFYGKVMDWHTKWSSEIRTLYHINGYRSGLLAKLHNRG